jgi:ubiquinone/menaquinone biosynthesis C-methylase UbiE
MGKWKRTVRSLIRYGEPGFDQGYLQWGFHKEERQRRELEFLLRALKPPAGASILDMGCGQGHHAVWLAERGFQVTAYDISPTFLQEAKRFASQTKVSVSWHKCSHEDADFPEGAFDVAYALESFAPETSLLQKVARWLKPGGLFLTDIINAEYFAKKGMYETWKEDPEGVFKLERHGVKDPQGGPTDYWITIDTNKGEILEETGTAGKGLSVDEVRERAAAAGLRLEKSYGDLDCGPISEESRRFYLVFRRA